MISWKPAERVKKLDSCVWNELVQMAVDYETIDLGRGFPDFPPPEYLPRALAEAGAGPDSTRLNQYTRSYGHPRLVKALAQLYSPLINRPIDPFKEILVTIGADEALHCSFMGHLNPGDEVILIEPFFDTYETMVELAGGVPVFIPLRPQKSGAATASSADWVLNPIELDGKFTERTKMLVLNTPNNPLGKVYSYRELEMIAKLCIKYNCILVADEVYEWMVYEEGKHIRIASLDGMWPRCITIGSAGKSFGVTGWKIGWAYGPQDLIGPLQMVHQNLIYTCPTILQEAVAVGVETETRRLNSADSYWKQLPRELQRKRDFVASFLSSSSMEPIIPEGGFFMIADFERISARIDLSQETDEDKDYRFVKWMMKNQRLHCIPVSCFFSKDHKHLAQNYVRFCFSKTEATLAEAERAMMGLKMRLETKSSL